ncbi:hypothetical protein ADUPG1_011921 [Aduncisulcus paluster]|uniref:BTB/POZ domain-containing protein n=1 Tax=Aduncisulcus paluster TaxID=2918883 RepID=A0ABQ5K1F9_9EUKA|nr:hypothetical protein ADUPG1_011921 [Aduncisulcus paluster]|eukprot:gnl/Carplike_NY0171/2176_a2927_945.p1 GENE.gnl/Carplike_NY0171/2176_a2927_945~~gnl/Carplike_NY0171/2176_a2927_945.p1  ORF type:complete len:460 (-),score=101.74 gnl/Carplike_NY0171/2176_a2927_945:97-1452(-)
MIEVIQDLPANLYELTVGELDANSSQSSLDKLLNGDTGSYWQTNHACPQFVYIKFEKPICVRNLFVYSHSSDSSFQPDQIKTTFSPVSGADIEVNDNLARTSGWYVIPCETKSKIEKITFNILRNHDGGYNSRLRGIAVEQFAGATEDTERHLHLKLLVKDLMHALPKSISPSKDAPALIGEKDEECSGPKSDCSVKLASSSMIESHEIILRSRIPTFEKYWDSETRILDLSAFDEQVIRGIIMYSYTGCADLFVASILSGLDSLEKPGEVGFSFESALKPVQTLFDVAKTLEISNILEFCFDFVGKKLKPDNLSSPVVQFVKKSESKVLQEILLAYLIQLPSDKLRTLMATMDDGFMRELVTSHLKHECADVTTEEDVSADKDVILGVVVGPCDEFKEGMKVHLLPSELNEKTLFYGVGIVVSVSGDDVVVDFNDEKAMKLTKMQLGKVL